MNHQYKQEARNYIPKTERGPRTDRLRELTEYMSIKERSGRKSGIFQPISGLIPCTIADIYGACEELRDRMDLYQVTHTVGLAMEGNALGMAFATVANTKFCHTTNYKVKDEKSISFKQIRHKDNMSFTSYHELHGLPDTARVVIIDDELESGDTALGGLEGITASGRNVGDIGTITFVGNIRDYIWKAKDAATMSDKERHIVHENIGRKTAMDTLIYHYGINPKFLYTCDRDTGDFRFVEPEHLVVENQKNTN